MPLCPLFRLSFLYFYVSSCHYVLFLHSLITSSYFIITSTSIPAFIHLFTQASLSLSLFIPLYPSLSLSLSSPSASISNLCPSVPPSLPFSPSLLPCPSTADPHSLSLSPFPFPHPPCPLPSFPPSLTRSLSPSRPSTIIVG